MVPSRHLGADPMETDMQASQPNPGAVDEEAPGYCRRLSGFDSVYGATPGSQ